jgi:zeaxanthin glucosyltransferase
MAVLHGGMNSVLDALSKAVPTIVMPIAFDQAAIAARVAWRGAGLVVHPSRLERDLEGAMRALRDQAGFRQSARLLAAEALAAGGVARAADLVEQQLGWVPPAEDTRQDRSSVSSRNG